MQHQQAGETNKMPYLNNTQDIGYYVPTTNVWDIQKINTVDVNSSDFKELLVNLYQNLNKMSKAVNTRDNGMYFNQELVNNQQWFSNINSTVLSQARIDYRKVVDFGALPNATTKSVPHGLIINANTTWTHIRATATDPIGLLGISLNYANTSGDIAVVDVDSTNVNITTNANFSNYTRCLVVLEFLKN